MADGWSAGGNAVIRNVGGDDRVRPNDDPVADPDATEDCGTCSDYDVVAEVGLARLGSIAESHPVIENKVTSSNHLAADDNADAMRQNQAGSDAGKGADLRTGAPDSATLNEVGQG